VPTKNLTVRFIDSIRPPASGRIEYWDATTPGFGLRVSNKGRTTWVAMYRHEGQLRRMTFGTYPTLPLADAREMAKDALRSAAKGGDPAAERKAVKLGDTFGDLAADYIKLYSKPKKRSWKEDENTLNRDLRPRFGRRKAASVKRREVKQMVAEIIGRGAPVMAQRTLELMRTIYNWAIEEERIEHNPCLRIGRASKVVERDRVLSEQEIRDVWKSLDQQPFSVAARLRLQLLTAQRSGEIRRIRWADIDLETGWWTIPAEFSKNKLSHRVPLSPWASQILRDAKAEFGAGEWLFPGREPALPVPESWRPLRLVREASGVNFWMHDLRRTAASSMTSIGLGRELVAKVLNHVEKGVTRVYDRYTYDREKRAALEAWAGRLEEILAGKKRADDKVVPLRPAAS
jgi:integrase